MKSFLKSIWKFLGFTSPDPAAVQLYSTAVYQARQELYFTEWAVPDDKDGRFDMVSLVTSLVNRRIGLVDRRHTKRAQELAQELFDVMFADMDLNLRELGVSDEGMKHRIKPMAASHLGNVKAYADALYSDDPVKALSAALRRNLYRAVTVENLDTLLGNMAAEALKIASELDACSDEDILTGNFQFSATRNQNT